jgi:hypothetical protein
VENSGSATPIKLANSSFISNMGTNSVARICPAVFARTHRQEEGQVIVSSRLAIRAAILGPDADLSCRQWVEKSTSEYQQLTKSEGALREQ